MYNEFDVGNDINEAYCDGFEAGVKSAKPRWISVADRLPEDIYPVNIVWVNREPESYYSDIKDKPFVATGVYFSGRWYWWSDIIEDVLNEYGDIPQYRMDSAIEVTHWAEIPEPPEEE